MEMQHVPVVLHYRGGMTESVQVDGRMTPTAESLRVVDESGKPAEVLLASLKAIFFLRTIPPEGGERPAEGSLLSVEFQDGEVIRGTSSEYVPDRVGFFLYPLDRSKTDRVFVVNTAVASIEVETF